MLVLVMLVAACGGAAPTSTPTPSTDLTGPLGDGGITFGRAFSEDTFEITSPSTTFPRGYAGIVWFIAAFSEAPATTSLTRTLTRGSGADEATVQSRQIPIVDPASPTLADGQTLAELDALQPGAYVMRYTRDATILAEGGFQVD